jgi:hypothetical protein
VQARCVVQAFQKRKSDPLQLTLKKWLFKKGVKLSARGELYYLYIDLKTKLFSALFFFMKTSWR